MRPATQQLIWLFAAVVCGLGAAFLNSIGLGVMAAIVLWVALTGVEERP